jgi:hypothetical protein
MADPRIIQKLTEDLENFDDLVNDIAVSFKGKLNSSLLESKERIEDLTEAFKKGKDVSKEIEGNLKKLNKESGKLALDRKSIEAQLADLANKRYSMSQKQQNKQKELLEEQLKQINAQLELNEAEGAYLETLQAEVKTRFEINNLLERANSLASIFDKIGLGTLFTFKGLLDATFKVDNEITQMGKSLGISHDMAEDLRGSMADYARVSNSAFVTATRLAAAQAGLTEQLGIAVDFGNEERETFARLTEITGLAADEAGRLAKFSAAAGTSTKDYVSDLRVAANTAMRTNKIHISDKELLSSVSKLSAGILVKFQGNPKALAESVIQAKKLGLNLEQVDKTAESLLNFESSIEAELEAELITGKKLNFERARAAALTGDQATLMQEVAAQAGSLAEFQDMNVLAQESLAKAFGMSRDEMSEMLMQQEAINKYGDAAAKLNKEQLEDMERRNMTAEEYLAMTENQRSTQERFNDLVLKLQDTFANIAAGPLGTIMSMFASIAENAGVMYTLIGAAAVIMGANMAASLGKTIAQLGVVVGLRTAEAAAAVTTAEAMTLGLATIGIIAGVAAVMGMLSSFTKGDDVVSPGYGKRMIFSPEGAVALNNQDTIVAGTNLGGGGINRTDGSMGMAGVMAAISNLATAVASKPTPTPQFALNVDGQQLGSVVGKQQETGTQQTKNSYRLA